MTHPYPIDRELPQGVFPREWRRSSQFMNFPVFSWNWYWRRALVYGPLGFVFGALLALPIGIYSGDWPLLIGAVGRTAPAWVFIMLFGPGLATWVRHRDFGETHERRLLLLAVLIGIVASYGVKSWYEEYIFEVVRPVLASKGLLNVVPSLATQQGIRVFYDVFLGLIIISSSGGRALFNYYYELRRWQSHGQAREVAAIKQERDESDRKLAVLQAQVEPHFLYNTLASVRSLVRTDPTRAEATIDALVDHLRATLPKFRDDTTVAATLQNQLEICRSYLDVMRVRTGERLSYSIQASPRHAALPFPPLMLISLVENAVKHGVEPKPGPCRIEIVVDEVPSEQGALLQITVSDDGAGLREGPSEGVGLANIRAQLKARFADRASVALRSREPGGTIARLTLPIEGTNT